MMFFYGMKQAKQANLCVIPPSGSGPIVLRSAKLELFRWQTIQVTRRGSRVTMVTGNSTVHAEMPGGSTGLTLSGALWVGGVENTHMLSQQFRHLAPKGFVGCIHKVKVSLI